MGEEEQQQARDYKDSLADALVPQILSSWLETVARTANEICKDADVRYERSGYCGEIVATARKDMECLVKAIDRHIADAPEVAREMLASCRAKMQAALQS